MSWPKNWQDSNEQKWEGSTAGEGVAKAKAEGKGEICSGNGLAGTPGPGETRDTGQISEGGRQTTAGAAEGPGLSAGREEPLGVSRARMARSGWGYPLRVDRVMSTKGISIVGGTDLAVRSLVEDRVCPPIFLFKRVHK